MESDPHSESDADLDFSDIPAVNALRRHLDNAGEIDAELSAVGLEDSILSLKAPGNHWHSVRSPPSEPPPPPPWPAEGEGGHDWRILATPAPYGGASDHLPDLPSSNSWHHHGVRHSAAYPYADMPSTPPQYPSSSSHYPSAKSKGTAENGSHSKGGLARSSHAATSRPERPRLKGRTRSDLWCEIFLDEQMLDVCDFEVEKKLIGKGGCNTKGIFLATGSKILVCGQGAERGKVRRKRMSHDHLRIEIVSDRQAQTSFRRAFDMVMQLIRPISDEFDRFCLRQLNHTLDGKRYWIGSTTGQALHCLGHLLESHHISVADDALEDVKLLRRPLPGGNDFQLHSALGQDAKEVASSVEYALAYVPPRLIDCNDPSILEAEEAAARHIRDVEELVDEPELGCSPDVVALETEDTSRHQRGLLKKDNVSDEAQTTRWQ
mmetsp:Transcript_83205/g.130933  ORF Transcript_83205/g.130933 Transcript_83205/m.130933 type:complete len:435 (-) Transcript_83205:3-1307(-)